MRVMVAEPPISRLRHHGAIISQINQLDDPRSSSTWRSLAAVLTWSRHSVPFVYPQACSVTACLKLVPRPVRCLRVNLVVKIVDP